jgi:hypothetical protein
LLFYLIFIPSRNLGLASRGKIRAAVKKLLGVIFGRWTIRSAVNVKIVIFQ